MTIIERVKNICLTPQTEWPVIAGEPTSSGALLTGYVAPLAAVGAAAGFVGLSLIGQGTFFFGTFRLPIVLGLVQAVISFVGAIVAVFVVSLIINALAPSFGAEKISAMAMKVAAYSYTPALAAGVLRVLPALGTLVILAALYGLYLLYLGLQSLMKSPQDKAVGYTAVVVISRHRSCTLSGLLGRGAAGAGALGAGLLTRGASAAAAVLPPTCSSTRTARSASSRSLARRWRRATRRSRQKRAATPMRRRLRRSKASARCPAAAGTSIRWTSTNSSPSCPTRSRALKKSSNAEKNGIAGLMVSKAEATYGDDGQKRVTLEVSDTGGVSGLMGLATWVGVQGEKDDDSGTERTQKVNGRLVHERTSKCGGDNEFGIVLGERFMVSAKGTVDLNTLKAAVQTSTCQA